ncbi:g-type lectin s-receptor-like serine/threonine-protein kinase [Quercus suber]|uniref:G-type lectin s-receptor-like serine/threonine-protein kinase n=1 Tax=Quercus suber TaxID=58331 RepID=A0AAW0LAW0_QUESU
MDSVYLNGFNFVDSQDGNFYLTFAYEDKALSYFALNSQGNLVLKYMSNGFKDVVWSALHSECDVYGKCGAFGTCDPKNTPICSCFQGFEPNNLEEWNQGNWTSGCSHYPQLPMIRKLVSKTLFLKLFCTIFFFEQALYFLLPPSFTDKVGDVKKIVTITVITGTIFLSICTYLLWRRMANLKGRKKKAKEILLFNRAEAQPKFHGEKVQLTSWKSHSVPSIGSFSCGIQPPSLVQVFIWKDGSPHWRSGPWNSRIFIGIPEMNSVFHDGFSVVDDKNGTISLSFSYVINSLFHYVLTTEGDLVERYWDSEKDDWRIVWNAVISECDVYGTCGAFGSCNSRTSPICSCLPGFEPKNTEEWNRGNWTNNVRDMKIIVTITVIIATLFISISTYFLWRWMTKQKARKTKAKEILFFNKGEARQKYHNDNLNEVRVQELPLFNFEKLASATNNFHLSNNLGQGGFGPVYRVWKLWNVDNIVALIDPMIFEPCFKMEILRCIHVGLLCVQDFAKERPTISFVISMLKSEIIDLTRPKQPAFTERENALYTVSSQSSQSKCSINNVTVTVVEGR